VVENIQKDGSAELWYGQFRNKYQRAHQYDTKSNEVAATLVNVDNNVANKSGGQVTVNVWLFGILAVQIPESPVRLKMPENFRVADIIKILEQKYGGHIFADTKRNHQELASCCRAFLDGYPIDNYDLPLDVDRESMDLELILLLAYEGG